MTKISDLTLIPIGMALTTIGGGAAFVTKLYYTTEANAAAIEKANQKVDELATENKTILQELATIKAGIGYLINKEKGR
jgi:cell division protein FtsB